MKSLILNTHGSLRVTLRALLLGLVILVLVLLVLGLLVLVLVLLVLVIASLNLSLSINTLFTCSFTDLDMHKLTLPP